LNREESTDRPTASGHRFGPDLSCSECGIGWDEHQRNPLPCKIEVTPNVFSRRPSGVSAGTTSETKESSQKQRCDPATDAEGSSGAADSASGKADSSRED
jgi:hypothetical protein